VFIISKLSDVHISKSFSHTVSNSCQVGVLFSNKTTPRWCHGTYCSGDKTQTPSYVVLQLSSLSARFPPSFVLLAYLFPSNPYQPLTWNTRFFQRSYCHCQNNGTLNERQMGVENISFIFANFRKCKKKKIGLVEASWNMMAHGDAREEKWRGNWRMQWVASTLHTTSEHGVSSITTADEHTSATSSRLNWCPPPI